MSQEDSVQIYLVGGAVRDRLLGLPVHERDWVVVGSDPQHMLALGFQPVGKEFPVFLHPETKEEYALARTERKVGKGYKGFVFYADSHVTLVQDLQRRDLTINAIAQSVTGELIDPYGGVDDLHHQVLRHVSPAFAEDPVRILRVARFAAKLPEFTIHPQTMLLMRSMVSKGEVDALVAERVWQELQRSLITAEPLRFWDVLSECGALAVLFPTLKLTPTTMAAFSAAIALSPQAHIRFAALLHELTLTEIVRLGQRYRLPRHFRELAELVIKALPDYQSVLTADASQIWQLFKTIDAFRRQDRFAEWLLTCQACTPSASLQQKNILQTALQAVQKLDTQELQTQGLTGLAMAQAIKQQQVEMIAKTLVSHYPLPLREDSDV